jgi:hypothetical protein
MKHIKWPSTNQFREVIRHVRSKAEFKGLDSDGNPIMDRNAVLPKIMFEGTVKLHGTNAGVTLDFSTGEMYAQSRENIITPQKDNAGFAMWFEGQREYFSQLFASLNNVIIKPETITVFGEWAGQGVQKGVAISQLPKKFYVFGISYTVLGNRYFAKTSKVKNMVNETDDIKCIHSYDSFLLEIDFENPQEAQNTLVNLTNNVEAECPVGKAHGVSGVGEGIVWKPVDPDLANDPGYWFKVKGPKHSVSKVKTTAPIDIEKFNNIQKLAEALVTTNRLEQMKQQVFGIDGDVDMTKTGEFIKAVMTDVWKEEKDTIIESGFTMKELNGPAAKIARGYLMGG